MNMMTYCRKVVVKQIWIVISAAILNFCDSCNQDIDETFPSQQVPIVNIQDPYRSLPGYMYTLDTETLRNLIRPYASTYNFYGSQSVDSLIKYPISYHKIVYTTSYLGNQITVSGAICIPIRPDVIPGVVSCHHGTELANSQAPSNATTSVNYINYVVLFNDYVVFFPDYIGYGSSSNILHPYYIYEPTVASGIDMIKAGQNYLNVNNIKYNPQKIFLTGHSEGGYVTVAVQKELETNPAYGIHITASGPSAGPYDLEETGNILFNADTYSSPDYILLLISAYNNYYWQLPLTVYFQQPYAKNAMTLLNGSFTEDEINQNLTTNLTLLLSTTFLNDYRGNGDTVLKAALKLNSVSNWSPKTPTRLYEGTLDSIVPPEIATDISDVFSQRF